MTRLEQALRWWNNNDGAECKIPPRHLRVLHNGGFLGFDDEGAADLNQSGRRVLAAWLRKREDGQARKVEGGGTARRVRSAKASGGRALLRNAYYRQGLRHAAEVVERVLKNWEYGLEEKHVLHGRPTVYGRMFLIVESAEVARVRLVALAEIEKLIKHTSAPEEK